MNELRISFKYVVISQILPTTNIVFSPWKTVNSSNKYDNSNLGVPSNDFSVFYILAKNWQIEITRHL